MNREQKKIYKNLLKRPNEVFISRKKNILYALIKGGLMMINGDDFNVELSKMTSEELNKFILDVIS